ncbi:MULTISPECIES: CoA transferase [unclassified Corynebacterium]|uniref:CoA transferase n=1 Tax=unclassified Corynebacterium TaxID=2624378 RepID=UPI0030A24F6E
MTNTSDSARPHVSADKIPTDALKGIHVVNMAANVPGPWAAARMRDMGAKVTRVLAPTPDIVQVASPAWYDEFNDGCELITIDAKSAEGRAQLDELLHNADVLITSVRPKALARMGVADAADRMPHLCHVEIVGDSADPEQPGHDLTYQAESGLLSPTAMPAVLLADTMGGENAVTAALGLLFRRSRTGSGGRARIGLKQGAQDAAAAHRHGLTAPGGPLCDTTDFYGIYEVADGHVAVAALEPHFAQRLTDSSGAHDRETLAAFLRTRKLKSVISWAHDHDLPISALEQ